MKEHLSHLSNLVALIYEDGKLDKKELDLLYRIAERYDIDESEIITILNQQIDFEFHLPESEEEKKNQLKDLVKMMKIDGNINPSEMLLLKKIADKFSISENVLNELIKETK